MFRFCISTALIFHISCVYCQFNIYGDSPGDNFGYATAVSGDGTRVVVGATRHDGNNILECAMDFYCNNGHVKVFELDGADWIQIGLDIDGIEKDSRCGSSVDISADGNIIVIGDRLYDGLSNNENYGLVRVFEWDATNDLWLQKGGNLLGNMPGQSFGTSVSISADGSRIAVGGPYDLPSLAGTAIVYEWQSPAWIQLAYFPGLEDEGFFRFFTRSVR